MNPVRDSYMMKIKLNLFKSKGDFWLELDWLIFKVSFVTFVILLAVDLILPGLVTNWLNPIWLLIISVILGIIFQAKMNIK